MDPVRNPKNDPQKKGCELYVLPVAGNHSLRGQLARPVGRSRRRHDGHLADPSGHLRAHRFGPANGHLVICVSGIAANSRWFDYLAERLAASGSQVVALDLRGRGYRSITPPGTYGWRNHALDVYAIAHALGATSFDYIAHSMGAYVGMQAGTMRDDGRFMPITTIS